MLLFNAIQLSATNLNEIVLNEKKQPIEFANITLFKTGDNKYLFYIPNCAVYLTNKPLIYYNVCFNFK